MDGRSSTLTIALVVYRHAGARSFECMTHGDACLAHESEERRRWQCHPSTGELERRQRYLSRPPRLSEEISYNKFREAAR